MGCLKFLFFFIIIAIFTSQDIKHSVPSVKVISLSQTEANTCLSQFTCSDPLHRWAVLSAVATELHC